MSQNGTPQTQPLDFAVSTNGHHRKYDPQDVYCMEFTRLEWRNIATNGGVAHPSAVPQDLESITRRNMERFTVLICCNADGSDKPPLWIIGAEEDPVHFDGPDIDPPMLNIGWQANKKAWYKKENFRMWLKAFDRHVGRDVVLILKRCDIHEKIYNELNRGTTTLSLRHTHLEFQPQGCTRLPFEAKLFNSFAIGWEQAWGDFFMFSQRKGRPLPAVLKNLTATAAAMWCVKAWEEIKPEAIQQAWDETGCLEYRARSISKSPLVKSASAEHVVKQEPGQDERGSCDGTGAVASNQTPPQQSHTLTDERMNLVIDENMVHTVDDIIVIDDESSPVHDQTNEEPSTPHDFATAMDLVDQVMAEDASSYDANAKEKHPSIAPSQISSHSAELNPTITADHALKALRTFILWQWQHPSSNLGLKKMLYEEESALQELTKQETRASTV